MQFRRPYLLLIALLLCAAGLHATGNRYQVMPETLSYKVMFKWGLINKKAGTATLSLRRDSAAFLTTLTAASEPWADRIFQVRDTLNGSMHAADLRPIFYEKLAHEGGEVKRDKVIYDYSRPGTVVGHCTRKVYKKNELTIDQTHQMEAEGRAVDMLTSFYFMRQLPFETMEPGQVVSVPIFSGKQKETLSIRYMGTASVNLDGTEHDSYHVRFLFTSKGGAKTSDDMDAWISTGPGRVPLKMEGRLPVGKVRCLLTSGL